MNPYLRFGTMATPSTSREVTDDGTQLLVFTQHKVVMELRHGVMPTSYENAHVVLCIGMAAGLHPDWESGTVMVPHRFTPFDLHNIAVMTSLTYEANNHLAEVLETVVALQDTQLLDAINHRYASANSTKASECSGSLQVEDFLPARLLQANGLFNPTTKPKTVAVLY